MADDVKLTYMMKSYLDGLRRTFPGLWRSLRLLKYPHQMLGRAEAVFTRIHRQNIWEASESKSGPGSTLVETKVLREDLPRLFRELGIRSLLDVPCGDFNWMSRTPFQLESYIGGDIVKSLIESNQRKFGDAKRRFIHLDLLRDDLPPADAIFCRDCMVHFSDSDVKKALANFHRSPVKFLVATTYPGRGPSMNIITGEWQPIDLEAAPFFLPAPFLVLSERHIERDGTDSHKSLGVWRLDDLRRL